MATVNTTPSSAKPASGPITHQPRPRKYMLAHERKTVDKALEILGSYMCGPSCIFTTPDAVKQYLCLRLGDLPHESFGVLFLDCQSRLIAYETMFRGTLTQTSVYPREVVIEALAYNAASVILTHNHPSGSPHHSKADKALTRTLKNALALVDVRVLDHVIVAGNKATSMAELGVM